MKPTITLIDGSPRHKSNTRNLLCVAAEQLRIAGSHVLIFSQANWRVPLFTGEEADKDYESVKNLFSMVQRADGIVLSSPEYHNSMSGSLKNILDLLNHFPAEKPFKEKVVGLIGGGGMLANSGATLQMMMAVRSLHGWLMPESIVSVPEIWDAFDNEKGCLKDENLSYRLKDFSERIVLYSKLFHSLRSSKLPAERRIGVSEALQCK